MRRKIIVLYARPWKMTKERDGEDRKGVSIMYMMSDSLKSNLNRRDGSVGYPVIKESVTVDCADAITIAPAIYEAEFEMTVSGGKNVTKVVDLVLVGSLDDLIQ